MARSTAQKHRLKLLREGKMDPQVKRSPFAQIDLDLRTKKTKTKKEKMNQRKHRNQLTREEWDGSFLYVKKEAGTKTCLNLFKPVQCASGGLFPQGRQLPLRSPHN
ncbi:hypothetical protein P6709_13135 [Jeotgalibacillus sp. ET6]|uniref:hypothetical protein n=1 Tax=Jeotgalibacillus sp. ET6 TaxID=3037260 RepID=UPI002418607E|nr:hypothetical protein [Jeotgalibacillus sp. ET6]MDG5472695.1 hypothetical protein [Jeotgalibacillus sp. ET6]